MCSYDIPIDFSALLPDSGGRMEKHLCYYISFSVIQNLFLSVCGGNASTLVC